MFLYIHVPFCESKCMYCKFTSTWKLQEFQIEKYVNEINKQSSLKGKKVFKSIYFWWWTPSVLKLNQLEKILSNYSYDNKTEITLESTPNKITKENLLGWKGLWINRLSIWVQSLNDKTLKEIARKDKGDILKALDNINLSLNPLHNISPLPNTPPRREGIWIVSSLPLGEIERGLIKEGTWCLGINNIAIDFIIWLPYVEKWDIKRDIKY